jgi:integrase
MILKFGAKHKWINYAPFDIQYPTEREKQNVEVLSRVHQKKMMNYIQGHFTFRNLGVYICLSSGIRIGEICALKWEDIDTDNGVIHVRRTIQRIYTIENGIRKTELLIDTPKTKNSLREIPLSKELLRMLKPIKKVVNSSFFVLTNDIKPTEPRTYRTYYDKLMKELEIPRIKFHGLRHSFATRCIESKCDYKTVSVLLGHSNISTTLNLYVHPNMEQKKKAIEQMFRTLK